MKFLRNITMKCIFTQICSSSKSDHSQPSAGVLDFNIARTFENFRSRTSYGLDLPTRHLANVNPLGAFIVDVVAATKRQVVLSF